MTRVTVIIPAYNAAATVEKTLLSALAQTHRDLEVFVVDDGSTDQTMSIANAIAQSDPRLTILHQSNSGVASARNNALARATGEYTCWLDADDLWHPTKIEKQLEVFGSAQKPLTFVYTGYRLVDPDDRIMPNFRTLADVSGNTLSQQIATNHFSNVSSIMVPTRLAQEVGGHSPKLREWGIEGAEDLLLQLQLASRGPNGCCREALVGYRMHSHNMSRGFLRAMKSNLKALEIIEQSNPDIPRWVFRLGRARTVGYMLHILKERDFKSATEALSQVWRDQPLYVLLTLGLITLWEFNRLIGLGPRDDPETGEHFSAADPASAIWHGPMLLTRWHKKRLDALDAKFSPRRKLVMGSSCVST